MAANLDWDILIEEERANIYDPAHLAYPTYAKVTALRRDNLKAFCGRTHHNLLKSERGAPCHRLSSLIRPSRRDEARRIPAEAAPASEFAST